jgi:SAM-dependent methyltransferase
MAADVRGRVLELGDDSYTRRFGGDAVSCRDILHHAEGNPHATVVADLSRAPHIPGDSYDCIIFTQALQLIYDTRASVSTLRRILREDGVVLATVPGITPVRRDAWADEWYWSFTEASAGRLFAEVFGPANVEVRAYGNLVAASAFLQGLAAEELRSELLDPFDPEYPVTITVRAVKRAHE